MPPVTEDLLFIFFVAHCVRVLHLKATTIKLYLCGIRFCYMRAGCGNPLQTNDGNSLSRLNTVMRGVKKQQGLSTRPRLPITFDILQRLCSFLRAGSFSPFLDIMLEAAFTLAFFGFLRCGEFCVSGEFNPDIHLCFGDVSLCSEQMCVTVQIKVSKCDPFRKGISILLFQTGHSVCPYASMQRYLQHRFISFGRLMPAAPLFVTDSGHPLTRTIFIIILNRYCEIWDLMMLHTMDIRFALGLPRRQLLFILRIILSRH